MNTIGFIGCGHMGSVLIKTACADSGNTVLISDASKEKSTDVAEKYGAVVSSNREIAQKCKYIFLCVRPQDLETVCDEIKDDLSSRSGYVLVNIAVGITMAYTKKLLNISSASVIRMMPNTPIEACKGVILYCSENLRSNDESVYKKIFAKTAKLYSIPEELMDAAGCVSGCGPAFVYRFISAFASAGEKIGLPSHLAYSLALNTVEGSAAMALEGKYDADELCAQVCSKGGTTERGVNVINDSDLFVTLEKALDASLQRTLELKK